MIWGVFHFNPCVVIFIVLAIAKGLTELFAANRRNKGIIHTSRSLTVAFIIIGVSTPILIFVEVVLIGHCLPLAVCVPLAAVFFLLLAARVHTIRILGKFYSVDVCLFEQHEIVRRGAYKYFRHPLYLINLLEYPVYPLACGAFASAVCLGVCGCMAIMWRKSQEEKVLVEHFGDEYIAYQKETWF